MTFKHARRHDHDHLSAAQRAELSRRTAGEETLVTDQVIDSLLERVRRMAYESKPKAFYQDKKELMLILTWPASWLNERAVGVPLERYESILVQILDGIQSHGDLSKMHHFPAYLGKCVRAWMHHNGEDLYAERKSVRNLIDMDILKGIGRATPKASADPIEAIAMAHRILAQKSRATKALESEARKQSLFGF